MLVIVGLQGLVMELAQLVREGPLCGDAKYEQRHDYHNIVRTTRTTSGFLTVEFPGGRQGPRSKNFAGSVCFSEFGCEDYGTLARPAGSSTQSVFKITSANSL